MVLKFKNLNQGDYMESCKNHGNKAILLIIILIVFTSLFCQTREELMRRHSAGELQTGTQRAIPSNQPTLYRPILGDVSVPSYNERLIVSSQYHPATSWTDKKGKTHTNPAYTTYSYAYTEGYQARAQSKANDSAKQKFPGNVVVTDLNLNANRNQEPSNAYVTFSPAGNVEWIYGAFIPQGPNKSMFVHNSERATVKAITDALQEIPTEAKIGSYIAQSRDMSVNNMVFDAIEETLFNLGYSNIVDRTDIDVTRYEQQLRDGFEFQDSSIIGFFSGADYVITARIDPNRVAIRILDVKTSTLKGRGTEDF